MSARSNGSGCRLPWLLVIAAALLATLGCKPKANADEDNPVAAADIPQDTAETAADAANAATDADRTFYNEALQSGVAEVALSEYARDKAASGDVRTLAGTLVRDHQALNEKLRRASGIANDPSPTAEQRSQDAHLRSLSGTAFDSAWLDHMAQGHARSIARYEAVADSGRSGQAKTLAAEALPTLRGHRDAIERLRVGGTMPSSAPVDDMPPNTPSVNDDGSPGGRRP